MITDSLPVSDAERKAIVALCIQAAFADGMQSEVERSAIAKVVDEFRGNGLGLSGVYDDALGGNLRLADVARNITSAEGKSLAYEMAVGICSADGGLNSGERQFLDKLRRELNVDSGAAAKFEAESDRLNAPAAALPPILGGGSASGAVPPTASGKDAIDEMIMNRAILAGALELMPQRLSTMAIVPIQMRLVYQIGKNHGYDLDWGHAKEFLATVGVGMTSQVVEGYLSKLVGSATKKFAGKLIGGLLSQATESAFAFATTYAIGQAAKSYYASGRTMNTDQLRQVFSTMLQQGQSMKGQFAGQIAQRSSTLNVSDFMPLVKERIGP